MPTAPPRPFSGLCAPTETGSLSALPARIGREGMAGGIGLHPPQPGLQKVEGDWRAPAGVFTIGDALGDVLLSEPMAWPMLTVTERPLWVEDSSSPHYNQHLVVPPGRSITDWESSQRMRRGALHTA